MKKSKIVFLLKLNLVLCVFLGLFSCEKSIVLDEFKVSAHKADTNKLTNLKRVSSFQGYTEYEASPYVGNNNTVFYFRVDLASGITSAIGLAVKFTHPVNGTNVVPMTYNPIYNRFELSKTMNLYNDYSYKYIFAASGTELSGASRNIIVLHNSIPLGDDYIYKTSYANQADKWSFYTRNCTSWVAWKVNQMWGTNTDFRRDMGGVSLGNAVNWASALSQLGYPSTSQWPRAGDIAWWGAYAGNGIGAYGHVTFVNSVNYSNNAVTITEYNWSPYAYSTTTISPSDSRYPQLFIHVQNNLHY